MSRGELTEFCANFPNAFVHKFSVSRKFYDLELRCFVAFLKLLFAILFIYFNFLSFCLRFIFYLNIFKRLFAL